MTVRTRYLNSFFYLLVAFFFGYFVWWDVHGPEGLCTSRYPFPHGDCIHAILPDDPRFLGALIKRLVLFCGLFVAGNIFCIVMFFVETHKERKAKRQREPGDKP